VGAPPPPYWLKFVFEKLFSVVKGLQIVVCICDKLGRGLLIVFCNPPVSKFLDPPLSCVQQRTISLSHVTIVNITVRVCA